jgi:hypothetical protein
VENVNAPLADAGGSVPDRPEGPKSAQEPLAAAQTADPDPRVIELYKTAVEMADRVSARRATSNAFFLTAQTALVAVIGLTTPSLLKAPWWTAFAVSLAGITLSASWWLQLRSYRDLNGAKFVVINAIEEDLPVKVFTDEWAVLQGKLKTGWSRRYMQLGTTERLIPGIFAFLYVLLFLGRVIR